MIPTVVPDVMSLSDDTQCDLWITLDINALHEEGGLQPVELQCVQHRDGLGDRTIVEGQCDDPAGTRSWRRSEGRRGRDPMRRIGTSNDISFRKTHSPESTQMRYEYSEKPGSQSSGPVIRVAIAGPDERCV